MFQTPWKNGSAAANNNSYGTRAWTNPVNALFDDGNYAFWTNLLGNDHAQVVRIVRPFLNNLPIGNDVATDQDILFGTTVSYGGSSNPMGTSLTGVDVNDAAFGIGIVFASMNGSKSSTAAESNYIVITGFNFDIPDNAVITGIEIQLEGNRSYSGPGIEIGQLDYAQMRLYYSLEIVETGISESHGFARFNEDIEPIISQQKEYQYLTYERGNFRGEWKDVISIPDITSAVNSLPGEMTVKLARNLNTSETEYDEIELRGYAAGDVLVTTQNNESILYGVQTESGIGTGTDLEVDHTVKVREYYGGYEDLLTHDGELLLTSQIEPLSVPVGYPRGRDYYQGYVSDFGLIYEPGELATEVKLLHLSDELNNEIYKSVDILRLNILTPNPMMGQQFGGYFKAGDDIGMAGQTLIADATYPLKRIVLPTNGWVGNTITLTFRTGNVIGAGTILGVATAIIPSNAPSNQLSYSFPEAIPIVNGTAYNFTLASEYERQTLSQSYPAWVGFGNAYANGGAYYFTAVDGWVASGYDLGFQLWEEGGDTRVNELSIDPSDIWIKVLDYNVAHGGIITYKPNTIKRTNTIVSAPFNQNTLKDAGDYIVKLSPSDWFYVIDPGDLFVSFDPRPTDPHHIFTAGKDIIRMRLRRSLEKLVNEGIFTGGGTPALLRSYIDVESRTQWRKALARMSDNRVTDEDTADIILQSEVGRYSQPIWLGTIEVLRQEHPTIVRAGQLAGFAGFGNNIDLLQLQVVQVKTYPDKFAIDLGVRLPKTSQRIEDIKRNLTRIEIENAPDAPE